MRSAPCGPGRSRREQLLQGDLSAWLGWWPERLTLADVLDGWQHALRRRGAPGSPTTVQLYLHFALCQASCRFCQYFHVVPRDSEQTARYTDYLVRLLGRYEDALGQTLASNAYFGGGTPTALPTADLERVMTAFARAFRVRSELTCEAHPGTLDAAKLDVLAAAGVNRLSMGLQSLDPAVLRPIGRTNPPLPHVIALVERARRLGMWVNTDLVLGLPGQTPASFRSDLDAVLSQVRPDCLTIYRYQPVERLPDRPPDAMRYSRVLGASLIARALRLGYLPATSGDDERPGKDFFRNSPATWGQWLGRLRYEVTRLRHADAELPVYSLFENGESHILGIGSGSMSHVYGRFWYREVTAVAGMSADTEPIYLGTRLTAEDECRSALLLGLAESRWIDARALTRRSGVDVEATFGALLADGARSGAIRRHGRWARRRHATSPGTHPQFYDALVPAVRDAAARGQHAIAIHALRQDAAFQKELVVIDDDHLRAVDPAAAAAVPGAPAGRSDDAVLAWAALVGLGAAGEHFAGAVVDRVGGGGEAHFRVQPRPAPPLRVIVEHDHGQRSFFRAGPYAISYATPNEESLAPAELAFLEGLCARTREAVERAAREALHNPEEHHGFHGSKRSSVQSV